MKIEKAQEVKDALESVANLKYESEEAKAQLRFAGTIGFTVPLEVRENAISAGKVVLDEYFNEKIKEAEAHLASL